MKAKLVKESLIESMSKTTIDKKIDGIKGDIRDRKKDNDAFRKKQKDKPKGFVKTVERQKRDNRLEDKDNKRIKKLILKKRKLDDNS